MPTRPIEEQVRRGLADKSHGRWVADVIAAFGYLESEFDHRLAEVSIHFRGSSIRYAGPVFDLLISYDPEDTGRIRAEFWVQDDFERNVEHPRALSVNAILRSRDSNLVLPDPDRGGLSEAAVREAMVVWAAGLRTLAPDVLRGTWPEGVRAGYLW